MSLSRVVVSPIASMGTALRIASSRSSTVRCPRCRGSTSRSISGSYAGRTRSRCSSRTTRSRTRPRREPVVLVFHEMWDMNLFYSDVQSETDIVGVGPGLCYVYMHDPGAPRQGGALTDGGSQFGTAPLKHGARTSVRRKACSPRTCISRRSRASRARSRTRRTWLNYRMPATWVEQVAKVGKATAGETSRDREWRDRCRVPAHARNRNRSPSSASASTTARRRCHARRSA